MGHHTVSQWPIKRTADKRADIARPGRAHRIMPSIRDRQDRGVMEPTGEPTPYGAAAPALRSDRAEVIALWRSCGLVVPHNPPEHDFDFALGRDNSDVLVARLADRIGGAVMVGHDGHRGWVYYIAVDPAHRREGFGADQVSTAETWLRDRGVRNIQLMVRNSNQGVLEFYRRIGYEPSPAVVTQRWLNVDDSQGSSGRSCPLDT